jgi:Sensors of blue-light using FAD
MALYHLVYRSRAVAPFPDDMLVELLKEARKHNQEKHISGILLYGYGSFIQLLEGDDDVIRDLYYNHIFYDPRHCDLKILQESYPSKRLFSKWAMAFRPLDKNRIGFLAGFVDPDIESEYGRNLLAPLRLTDAIESLARDVEQRRHEGEQ